MAIKSKPMKIFLIILGVLAIIFIIIQIFAMSGQKGIETYSYEVDKKYADFELRTYEASLFTSVKLPNNGYRNVSSKGFSILAGYIFGGNEKKEKIAMTSPVSMSLEDSMTMMFMVPKNIKKEDLPQPNQSKIEFHEEPAKKVAAISFGGWADDEKIEKYKNKLIAALDREGIAYSNRFYFFGYNAPYEMLNRKNEVIVDLVE
jgi:hypothetical protein